MKKETIKMIEEMASIKEPFELFEPYFWKDKIGDSLWHCEIRSCDSIMQKETGETLNEAVLKCYNNFKKAMALIK